MVRLEKGLPIVTELLSHSNDRVVRAMSGALRNLAIDNRNSELLGKMIFFVYWKTGPDSHLRCENKGTLTRVFPHVGEHALPHLLAVLPGGQNQSRCSLTEETVVSVLSTLTEVLGNNVEAAKKLRLASGVERLVLISKDG